MRKSTGLKLNRAARTWLLLLLALVGLSLTSWLATQERLVLGEEYVLRLAYGLPEDLRLIFLVVTLLGSIWILAIVLPLLFVKERFDIALRLILASSITFVITGIAKELIGRPRPGLLSDILQREILVLGYGFPSGHTSLATAIALLLGAYLPKKRKFIVWVWIGSVALSRLYLGVHAPLDIIGGFCIGLLAAVSVLLVLPPHKNVAGIRVAKPKIKA